MTTAPAIVVDHVTKRFERRRSDAPSTLKEALLRGCSGRRREAFLALRDISFEVSAGSAVGIVGQNGAGKSTLLRLIGGVGKPTSGQIHVRGKIGALLDLTAGFHPDLTGRENVFVTGVICGLTRAEVAERMRSIVAFAGLEQFIDNPIRTYSTGMQMRLGFSVAVHTDPDVLLVDEALAVGDLAFQQKCVERIRDFKTRGRPEIVIGNYVAELNSATRRVTPVSKPPVIAPSGRLLAVHENRFGSMELEITGVTLLDCDGRSIDSIASGESLTVSIEFRAPRPVAAPVFSVSISRDDGVICIDTNTAAQGLTLPAVCDRGEISVRLDRLDLTAGQYFVDVGVFEQNWSHGYDYHWHVYPLSVRGPESKGFLNVEHTWRYGASDSRAAPQAKGLRTRSVL